MAHLPLFAVQKFIAGNCPTLPPPPLYTIRKRNYLLVRTPLQNIQTQSKYLSIEFFSRDIMSPSQAQTNKAN